MISIKPIYQNRVLSDWGSTMFCWEYYTSPKISRV